MTLQEQSDKTAPSPSGPHLKYLDGLRAFAALYVVLHHLNYYLPPRPKASTVPTFAKVILLLTAYGHYAVTVFIVISGFCLMLPVVKYGELRGGSLHFFKKRAHRILPPYYLSILLALGLISTVIGSPNDTASLWHLSLPVQFHDLVMHLLLVHDILVSTASKINYILWSVAVEWRIYFLFPLLLVLWKKINAFFVSCVAVIVSLGGQFLLAFTPLNNTPTGICFHYIGLFVLGMLACEVSFGRCVPLAFREKMPWGWAAFFVFVVAALTIFKLNLPFYLNDLLVAGWAMLLLIHLSLVQKGLTFSLLSQNGVAFLGTFAYSVYLTHPMVLQVWRKYVIVAMNMPYNVSFYYSYTLGIVVVVSVAYFFFLVCERPFLNSKKSRQPLKLATEGNAPL